MRVSNYKALTGKILVFGRWSLHMRGGHTYQQQQQQHKLYLHDHNYLVTVLQKLKHEVTTYNNENAMQ